MGFVLERGASVARGQLIPCGQMEEGDEKGGGAAQALQAYYARQGATTPVHPRVSYVDMDADLNKHVPKYHKALHGAINRQRSAMVTNKLVGCFR